MIIVADNFTVSNPLILEKLKNKDEAFFRNFFKDISKITNTIDLNLGQIKKEYKDIVKFIFQILNSEFDFNIIIDTINADIIKESLKYCKKSPIINALSMDEDKINKILPIVAENNLSVVALVMSKFIPKTLEEKINLAMEIVEKITEKGVGYDKIILDPVVAPLGWEDGEIYNKNNLEFIKIIKDVFPEKVKTMMGFSNLTTGAVGKNRSVKILDAYYMAMCFMNGLDYALVNVKSPHIKRLIDFIDVLNSKKIFSPSLFE